MAKYTCHKCKDACSLSDTMQYALAFWQSTSKHVVLYVLIRYVTDKNHIGFSIYIASYTCIKKSVSYTHLTLPTILRV